MRSRGLALLLVVGVLSILAVLAAAFVTLARLERRASLQRLHASKALLLARSGIEDALARISAGQDPDLARNRYGGEDWDLSGGPLHPAFEAPFEVYGPGTANLWDCPVRHAMRPSFPVMNGLDPRLLSVDQRQRGYTGRLRGEQETYAVQVKPQAGIHVNGGDPAQPVLPGNYNETLRRVLGILAEAVDREDGVNDGLPVDLADGQALVNSRPASGWKDWGQVRAVLGWSEPKLQALRDYLTLHAWVDMKVIRPNAPASMLGTLYTSWADLKMAHGGPPDFERINGKVVGRSPVSLAWARTRRPALLALLAGIRGYYLDEFLGGGMHGAADLGIVREAPVQNTWSAGDDAHLVADQILASTSDLSTWAAWNAFADTLNVTNTGYGGAAAVEKFANFRQAKRDVLKAHFNPNSDLNKFNPNRTLWRSVDKSDLSVYSTEFSLEPLHGFELACVGRVLGADGRLAASRVLKAEVGGPRALRLTTQRDFMAGDAGEVRLPGQAGFLAQSQGLGKTWGHKLAGLGKGISLQAYPEPVADAGAGLAVSPADYDGNLQLATVETPDDWTYLVSSAPDDMKCLARFDTDFNLEDVSGGFLKNLGDTQLVTTAELGNGLLHDSKPVTLYPDGAFSEKGRCPAYRSLGNAHGFHGLASFWVKAQYTETDQDTGTPGGRQHTFLDWVNIANVPNSLYNQYLGAGHASSNLIPWLNSPAGPDRSGWGFLFETGHASADLDLENGWTTPVLPFVHHRWQLMSFCWDLQNGDLHRCGEFVLNGGAAPGEKCPSNLYIGQTYNDVTMPSDLSAPDATGPNRFCLGGRVDYNMGSGDPCSASATIDEFAIWDFGPQDDDIVNTLASERHAEGRYYKGGAYNPPGSPVLADEAGSWVSAPLALPEGGFLRRIAWTWLRPPELPDDFAEVELLDLSGTAHLWGAAKSRSTLGPGWSAARQAWEVGGSPAGSFRLRAVFRRVTPLGAPGLPEDTPILDSPVLDDLTLLYDPAGGAPVLRWEQGE